MRLFEDAERGPDDGLRLQFEAVAHLDPHEREAVQTMIAGVLHMHDAKRWELSAGAAGVSRAQVTAPVKASKPVAKGAQLAALRSQFATSNEPAGRGGRRYLPRAFTEHGAIMAASVLNSPRAIEVSMYVVRAFVRLCELAATHKDLAKRLDAVEEKTELLAMQHDTFRRNTPAQLKQVFKALRELMTPPQPSKRPIGFVAPRNG